MVPVGPEQRTCCIEAQRIGNKDDEEGNPVAIEVLGTKIVPIWIEIANHGGNEILSIPEGCRKDRCVE